jgi:cytochrome b561
MWRNSKLHWGLAARWFHWIGAAVVAVLLGHGWWMTHQAVREQRFVNYGLHADLGYIFLALLLVRFIWKLINPTPDLPADSRGWERLLAHVVHWLLYALMGVAVMLGWGLAGTFRRPVGHFALPAIVSDRTLHEGLEHWHRVASYALLAVVVVHVAAALWHHFVKRNDILRRMTRGLPAESVG